MPQKSIFSYHHLRSALSIYSYQLHEKWKEEIVTTLSSILIGHCEKEIGYICEIIIPSVQILSQSIIEEGMTRFLFKFQVKALLPFSGCRLEATIDMVTSYGLFLVYHQYLRIMIPLHLLEPQYTFRKLFSSNVFFHSAGKQCFQVHDKINIEIVECRFEEDHFYCIANYVESS